MSRFWEDLKKTMQKGFDATKDKAEEYGKIGKAKGEIVIIKQKINKAYGDLGEAVRPLIEKDKKSTLAKEEKVAAALKTLADLEKSIKQKEKEIAKAREEAEAKVHTADKEEEIVEVEAKPVEKDTK